MDSNSSKEGPKSILESHEFIQCLESEQRRFVITELLKTPELVDDQEAFRERIDLLLKAQRLFQSEFDYELLNECYNLSSEDVNFLKSLEGYSAFIKSFVDSLTNVYQDYNGDAQIATDKACLMINRGRDICNMFGVFDSELIRNLYLIEKVSVSPDDSLSLKERMEKKLGIDINIAEIDGYQEALRNFFVNCIVIGARFEDRLELYHEKYFDLSKEIGFLYTYSSIYCADIYGLRDSDDTDEELNEKLRYLDSTEMGGFEGGAEFVKEDFECLKEIGSSVGIDPESRDNEDADRSFVHNMLMIGDVDLLFSTLLLIKKKYPNAPIANRDYSDQIIEAFDHHNSGKKPIPINLSDYYSPNPVYFSEKLKQCWERLNDYEGCREAFKEMFVKPLKSKMDFDYAEE